MNDLVGMTVTIEDRHVETDGKAKEIWRPAFRGLIRSVTDKSAVLIEITDLFAPYPDRLWLGYMRLSAGRLVKFDTNSHEYRLVMTSS